MGKDIEDTIDQEMNDTNRPQDEAAAIGDAVAGNSKTHTKAGVLKNSPKSLDKWAD
jgi:hypothetical protein